MGAPGDPIFQNFQDSPFCLLCQIAVPCFYSPAPKHTQTKKRERERERRGRERAFQAVQAGKQNRRGARRRGQIRQSPACAVTFPFSFLLHPALSHCRVLQVNITLLCYPFAATRCQGGSGLTADSAHPPCHGRFLHLWPVFGSRGGATGCIYILYVSTARETS